MINKKTALIIAGITGFIGATSLILLIKSADIVDNAFQKSMRQNGFEISNIETIEKRIGAIRYHNITLGSEGKSSINLLDIKYKALLLNKITSLSAQNIFLSGEIDINAKLDIKGINDISKIFTNTNLTPDTISLKNINLSLLSAHFGGIRGVANIAANRENNALIWTGNIDSRQDQLELIAKLNAQRNDTGTWIADLEIENAKLERSFGKFTRVNGTINWGGNNNTWQTLKADLSAGGFIAHDTNWQNASIAIEGAPQAIKTYIDAKSSGVTGLELTIEAVLGLKNIRWDANIHAETGEQLVDYLTTYNMNPLSTPNLNEIKASKNINLRFKLKEKSLIFNLKDQLQKIDIKGKIEKKSTKNFTATIASSKNFQNGLNGEKCKKDGSLNQQICYLDITYHNKKYSLKN